MQRIKNIIKHHCNIQLLSLGILLVFSSGCSKFLSIPLPSSQIAGEAAFQNDASVAATINNVYNGIISGGILDGSGSAGYESGLYTDELTSVTANNEAVIAFYTNTVTAAYAGGIWSSIYKQIYSINATIEGVEKDTSVLLYPRQWLGEAYFLRGFLYFTLTNLYGDVPLVTSTLYTVNNVSKRSSPTDIYQQMIADLKQAQILLSDSYYNFNGQTTSDRSRPNKAAATAMLARAYLYTADYADAEALADSVINKPIYKLDALNNVFLNTSQEMIWGVDPSHVSSNVVKDAPSYIIATDTTPQASGINVVLSNNLLSVFETGDQRFTQWIGVSHTSTANYYYADKYKQRASAGVSTEYIIALRLAEQYLIRAEARARNNNLSGAQADLNAVRARAGLQPTTASSQSDIIDAILHERQTELFTECGQRFFDLRRTGNLDKVMNVVSPEKGSTWQSFMQWWPIPTQDIQANPNLTQTPGYQQ